MKIISFVTKYEIISAGILKTTEGRTWTIRDAGTVYDYRSISFADTPQDMRPSDAH
jgi:hypothetical protein